MRGLAPVSIVRSSDSVLRPGMALEAESVTWQVEGKAAELFIERRTDCDWLLKSCPQCSSGVTENGLLLYKDIPTSSYDSAVGIHS